MMKRRKQKKNPDKNQSYSKNKADIRLPFIEHIRELRRRLFYIALSVLGVAFAAYAVQQRIVHILLAPAKGQHFIYTSPGGGIDFLFRVCIYTGIVVSIPLIIYQLLQYISPLFKDESTTRTIAIGSMISGVFAVLGVVFGYYVGMPAVLHFLFHQFTSQQIQPLITIQSYISFVTLYMLGSSLLLQVPLVLVFINRIKPLKPSGLIHQERWVILGAFVVSAIMNPTPNIISQLMVAGPIIIMYQVGIAIIWLRNRHSRYSPKVTALLKQDAEARAVRLAAANGLKPFDPKEIALPPLMAAQAAPAHPSPIDAQPTSPQTHRPIHRRPLPRRMYLDFRPTYPRVPQAE
jgi:sec-independent protein translocase protein TatC